MDRRRLILEFDMGDKDSPVINFDYANGNDPRPKLLWLGDYHNPNTDNELVGGINMHYIEADENLMVQLRSVVPKLTLGKVLANNPNILKSNANTLENAAYDVFDIAYRTYNKKYVDGETWSDEFGSLILDIDDPEAEGRAAAAPPMPPASVKDAVAATADRSALRRAAREPEPAPAPTPAPAEPVQPPAAPPAAPGGPSPAPETPEVPTPPSEPEMQPKAPEGVEEPSFDDKLSSRLDSLRQSGAGAGIEAPADVQNISASGVRPTRPAPAPKVSVAGVKPTRPQPPVKAPSTGGVGRSSPQRRGLWQKMWSGVKSFGKSLFGKAGVSGKDASKFKDR